MSLGCMLLLGLGCTQGLLTEQKAILINACNTAVNACLC